MKLKELKRGYFHPIYEQILEQTRKECALYEGLILSHPPQSIIASINSTVTKRGSIRLDKPTDRVFSVMLNRPIITSVVEQIMQRVNVGGWFLATANVVYNDKYTAYNSIREALNYINTSNLVGLRLQLVFEAKYGFNIVGVVIKRYKQIYHATPTEKIEKILRQGLSPKTYSKKSYHPDRIYMALTYSDALMIATELSRTHEKPTEYSILKIDTQAFNRSGVQLFTDPAFEKGVFTLSNVAPHYITVVK